MSPFLLNNDLSVRDYLELYWNIWNTFLLLLLYPSPLSSLKYGLRFLSSFFISVKPLSLKTNFVALAAFYNVIVLFLYRGVHEIFSFQLFNQIALCKMLWDLSAEKFRYFYSACRPLSVTFSYGCDTMYSPHTTQYKAKSWKARKQSCLSKVSNRTVYSWISKIALKENQVLLNHFPYILCPWFLFWGRAERGPGRNWG